MSVDIKAETSAQPKAKIAGGAAALAATGAVACGVCCVLPFALPAAMLAATGGALAWFAGLMPWITGFAVLAVVGAWIWVGVQTLRTRRRPAPSTLVTMGLASAFLVTALAWPRLEGFIIAALRG